MTEAIFDLSAELATRTRRTRVKAVVLAGGKGTRLAPYTSVLPKPLMPIGDRSILELVLGQFATFGITDVTLCVGHLSHLIEAVVPSVYSGARLRAMPHALRLLTGSRERCGQQQQRGHPSHDRKGVIAFCAALQFRHRKLVSARRGQLLPSPTRRVRP